MKFLYDIPASFWGLFRSVNREIYMEALLTIDDEYQYNNFFLSREACVQILGEMCAQQKLLMEQEETETEEEAQEAVPKRILNWLLPVSYTHLDVYKRQPFGTVGIYCGKERDIYLQAECGYR